MNFNPLVSVIIPLFNQKQFISEAINSVLAQKFKNVEIIVVDDGSTDLPDATLDTYKSSITLVRQENKGLAAARNRGLIESTGEYIQFLDADDSIFPEKIERQIRFIYESGYTDNVIPYCGCIRVHGDNLDAIRDFEYQKVDNMVENPILKLIDLFNRFPLPIHSALLKKSLIENLGGFDENMKGNEDRLFWTRACLHGSVFVYDNTYNIKYRKHSNSMTHDKAFMLQAHIQYLDAVENIFSNKEHMPLEIKKKITEIYFRLFYSLTCKADSKKELKYIAHKINMSMPEDFLGEKNKLKRYFISAIGIENYLITSKILKSLIFKP